MGYQLDTYLAFKALDNVAPSYVDPTLVPFGGNTPVLLRGAVVFAGYTNGGFGGFGLTIGSAPFHGYTYTNMRYTADVAIPRAIGYSAGIIDFFFRGKLDIEPIEQKIFAVLNQGAVHTVDGDGYPRKPDGTIFGFEKIRLKIRNSTAVITESGTNVMVPQIVGAGKLIAIARYHRNACYKETLAGERTQTYGAPPLLGGVITEPVCGALSTRTNYQEISVSAEMPIASETDLPGGRGGAPATLEKTFDFTADPIPINATDLIIQVVYRGQLGGEPRNYCRNAAHDARLPSAAAQ